MSLSNIGWKFSGRSQWQTLSLGGFSADETELGRSLRVSTDQFTSIIYTDDEIEAGHPPILLQRWNVEKISFYYYLFLLFYSLSSIVPLGCLWQTVFPSIDAELVSDSYSVSF
ncbi:hypothetical protein ASPZODRAFT_129301 [Penicilliopsis zonata CBS 506.65]|uniref:Uncharacterized protein n=1 Tax=Penicilliopsis zonata CBS 506.65 TaxID=1073090 RepID=A0A1L9SPI4_9EURO|nr:hypothetical protein ASPZODRAFT_129301 [Penicilliopsis zonata CBS 506.65]OJJ48957.1 hypothetical protein ASPZODRAFT_129301 [Penicilliopsis zonata CBS 506.65]